MDCGFESRSRYQICPCGGTVDAHASEACPFGGVGSTPTTGTKFGWLAEWTIALSWKGSEPVTPCSVGSNPTPSARTIEDAGVESRHRHGRCSTSPIVCRSLDMEGWQSPAYCGGLENRWASDPCSVGSNPTPSARHARVAQLVERRPEKARVGGSRPSLSTIIAVVAQLVEHSPGTGEVAGSIPAHSTRI